jgi:hypothetical protein
MSLSNVVENEMLLDFLTRHSTLYLALSTTDPGEDGSGISEPVGGGYVRRLIGDVTITDDELSNDDAITFPISGGDWGLLAYGAIFTQVSGGTFLMSGAATPTECPIGTTIVVPAETVLVSMN